MVFLGIPIWFVFVAFVVASLVASFAATYEKLNKRVWRNLVTSATIISGAGILGLAIDTRAVFVESSLARLSGTHVIGGHYIRDHMEIQKRYFCDTVFIKTENSPRDFDESVADQEELCAWYSKYIEALREFDFQSYKRLETIQPAHPILKGNSWAHELKFTEEALQYHETEVEEARQLTSLQNNSLLDFFRLFLPLTLAISFGIQVGATRKI